MSEIVIQSAPKIPNRIQISPPAKSVTSPKLEQIDSEVNSSARRGIAEKALEKAMNLLSNMFSAQNISVSKTVDIRTGQNTVQIQDAVTGKTITSMPPQAAIQIAAKAKEKSIGWLIDRKA